MLPTPPPSQPSGKLCAPEDRIGLVLRNGLQLVEVLGVGAYGVVYRALDQSTNTSYAVKALNKDGLDIRQRTFHDREIYLHQQASSHPNVVSMLDIIDGMDCTYVVLEYLPERDLFTNIVEHGLYVGDDVLAKTVFLQLLDAVEYCHSLGIYHRDLKPENILVADGGMSLKLADFGLATTDALSSDFGCGSTFYMSPECQETPPNTFARYASAPNDVWSLGVILVNLTCGRNPWKRASVDDSTFSSFLQNSEFLKEILPLTDELDSILRRIFECDPVRRITIPQLRSMILRCTAFTKSETDAKCTSKAQKTKLLQPQSGSAGCNKASPAQKPSAAPQPVVAPFHQPEPYCQPETYNPYYDLAAQFSQLTTSSGSSGSNRSSWSELSAVSSASSIGSFRQMSPPPKVEAHTAQAPLPAQSIQPNAASWLCSLIPTLDIAQKHMMFLYPLPACSGVRLF